MGTKGPKLARAIVDDRCDPRIELAVVATVDAGSSHKTTMTIVNISALGLMAETRLKAVPGQSVTVCLPAIGPVSGRIAWRRAGHIGIAFAEPLSHHQLSALV